MKETSSIRRIQRRPIRRIGYMACEYSGRYQTWSLLQETPIRRIQPIGYACMTRSSTSELFTPYKEHEREFRSSRKHFKTLSLDELRSPDFNLLSGQEYSEEEVAETMVETIEQYMSKTRADYGSGVVRPKIEEKDNFELKGPFSQRILGLTPSAEAILFYNRLGISTQQILNSRGAIPLKTAADAKVAIQEMVEYSQEMALNGTSRSRSTETSDGLASIQAQLNNLGREIKKVNEKVYAAQVGCDNGISSTDDAIRNKVPSIKTLKSKSGNVQVKKGSMVPSIVGSPLCVKIEIDRSRPPNGERTWVFHYPGSGYIASAALYCTLLNFMEVCRLWVAATHLSRPN
ncbi:hypothetical protein Tco_1120994 [Tanacetum coccineum]|uniref:Uncharacterized protein n=1 Tax=Tanacetum coccineum TaxID=301880 RepID=A0ABQ5IWM2_9ASTR